MKMHGWLLLKIASVTLSLALSHGEVGEGTETFSRSQKTFSRAPYFCPLSLTRERVRVRAPGTFKHKTPCICRGTYTVLMI